MNLILNNEVKMTSLDLAELTGKRHADIMRDIRVEKEKLDITGINSESIFKLSKYQDSTGRNLTQYTINEKGIKLLAVKYKKLKNDKFQKFLVEKGIIVDFLHTQTRFEMPFLDLLENALEEIDIFGIRQFKVENYRIDFYIPSLKLAVEYDEQQHNYMEKQDTERMSYIVDKLGCEFIRCDYKVQDIKNVMKVLKKINFRGNK